MTLPLVPIPDPDIQFNFDEVAQQFPFGADDLAAGSIAPAALSTATKNTFLKLLTVADRHLAFGTGTLVFTASDASAQLTVAHGLGATPVLVLAMAKQPASARVTIQETSAATSTNVLLTGFTAGTGVVTLSQAFYWLAVA